MFDRAVFSSELSEMKVKMLMLILIYIIRVKLCSDASADACYNWKLLTNTYSQHTWQYCVKEKAIIWDLTYRSTVCFPSGTINFWHVRTPATPSTLQHSHLPIARFIYQHDTRLFILFSFISACRLLIPTLIDKTMLSSGFTIIDQSSSPLIYESLQRFL